jgi:hypothetical protein
MNAPKWWLAFWFVAITAMAPSAQAQIDEKQASEIGVEAYVYGYSLVTMEYTRRIMTNAVEPVGTHAPMGRFVRMREYPNAQFRDVTAPNADTLYSTAWLDLSKEPYILSLPDMGDRYFLMPMLDAWTNVFEVPGTRTTGNRAKTFAITGPGWKGTLPEGVQELKAPTSMVWILGRTYCKGTPEDYKKCHAIMDKYDLRPLSEFGKPYTPPAGKVDPKVDMKTAVREQVNKLDVGAYFKLMATLMKDNPPAATDAPILAKLNKIGFTPGKDFDISKVETEVAKGLTKVPAAAQEKIMGHFKEAGKMESSWTFTLNTGIYGTDYLQRALITAIGLGANRPQDAIYPTSVVDAEGKPYTGSKKYVLHFEKGKTPPTNAFWSVTMYDTGYFFVDNPLNKYTVSPRDNLKLNSDGSLDLYIQHESPGKEKEANWLPAPKEGFILMMRLYWPRETDPSIIKGTWQIPGVNVVK